MITTHKQLAWIRREILSSIRRHNWKQAHFRLKSLWWGIDSINNNETLYCAALKLVYFLDMWLFSEEEGNNAL